MPTISEYLELARNLALCFLVWLLFTGPLAGLLWFLWFIILQVLGLGGA
jgi:hypothetical protein